jgi:hypothetical protein
VISYADVEKLRGMRAPGPVMVQGTLDDNGQVTAIRDAPFSVAAKLRFPVTGEERA